MGRARTLNEQIAELLLEGSLARTPDGGFTLTLTGSPGEPPVDPGEPPVDPPVDPGEPPEDAVVITPTGGDDANLIAGAWNSLPDGDTLILSGMFHAAHTIFLDGFGKTLAADPGTPSGIRSTNAGLMAGPYASMVCVRGDECMVRDLEFDAQGYPTELVFFQGTNLSGIQGCWLRNVACHSGGPPYGAIHSEGVGEIFVVGNRVENTKVNASAGSYCRGIWVRANRALVENNTVRDTAHTGIAVEAVEARVAGNLSERAQTDGTGMKMCYRQSGYQKSRGRVLYTAPVLYFTGNIVRDTLNGGLMLEDCGSAPVLIEDNQFVNCGAQGTTFGAVYSPHPTSAVTWRLNRVENCRSLGALRQARNWMLTETEFAGGDHTLWLEEDCHYITLDHSGSANVGPNCDHIVVDGKQVA